MAFVPRPLLPHQEKALAYCRSITHPALFMEMRLGKTKVVIEWLRPLKGRVLVAAPLTTVRAWEEELRDKEGETSIALLLGTTKQRMEAFSKKEKWNLINLEGLRTCPAILENFHWDAVVVDESTRIKNPKAGLTELLVKHARADRRCILSGNPAPEGPLDYCTQFLFLKNHFMGFSNFWAFRNVLFSPVPRTHKWFPRPSARRRIRNWVQANAFVQTRKEVGLANEKIYEKRYVKMEPEQKRLTEKLENEFVLETPDGEKSTMWAPVKSTWLARLAGGYVDGKKWFKGKSEELLELLQGELAVEQVIVWFRFNAELRFVENLLQREGISSGAIDGTVAENSRAGIRQAFANKRVRVLLLQQKVGRFGLDLSSASTAIYYSNGYSSEDRTQSEDRIEHPKKKEPLLIIDLVTEGSVDEDVVKALARKKKESDYYLKQAIDAGIRRRALGRTSHH